MTISLKHLRSFATVAEELHFGRAAARLGVEQSPLSRQIRDLEADLKVRLFERTRRWTRLTPAGERFVLDARRILADVDGCTQSIRAYAAGAAPLRLGLSETIAGAAFGRLLRLCREARPTLAVILIERPLPELYRSLQSGGLDAILAPSPVGSPELETLPAWSEPMTLVTPAPQSGERGIDWLKPAANAPWIMPDPDVLPGCAGQIGALLERLRLSRRSASTYVWPATLVRLVIAGAGVGLLPVAPIGAIDGISFRRLKASEASLTTWLTLARDDDRPVLTAFRRLVAIAATDPVQVSS
jgi:DNA-binding transcriptional LysR family regulator